MNETFKKSCETWINMRNSKYKRCLNKWTVKMNKSYRECIFSFDLRMKESIRAWSRNWGAGGRTVTLILETHWTPHSTSAWKNSQAIYNQNPKPFIVLYIMDEWQKIMRRSRESITGLVFFFSLQDDVMFLSPAHQETLPALSPTQTPVLSETDC